MNAVEIEEAVSELAAKPFDAAEFPFAFLAAFGNKETTVKRLRSRSANASDVQGGVLQRNNIHIVVCPEDRVGETLTALRASPKTAANKAKFILATDGLTLEAEDLNSGETIACPYPEFARHFGFFLPLAGISTVRAIKNNPIDIKATGRLNKLYVELLKDNPDWATEARRQDMNQFMARLIFCFFAEDTGIFLNHLFTKTVEQMSDSRSGNTHEVLQELFRAMATPATREARQAAKLRPWADAFPYVNGGLFSDASECPRFSRIARSYLLRAAELDWQQINPDIFGSMIQAVADDEERGALGMHYTSVPNILKVLNPLFLDDLREQLEAAGDNLRKLRNLRKRLSTIRVFDPACGSGNFLVIAYIKMREIEHDIVKRTGDAPKSCIPLSNFYGIEIKGFAAEIARLSLLIAEFQCDVRMISQQEAQLNVLPLHRTGQIRTGNALRLDWLEVCPPAATPAAFEEHDLAGPTGRLALGSNRLGEAAESTETYICGNPPYSGYNKQSAEQKVDLEAVFSGHLPRWGNLDYVAGWFMKAALYAQLVDTTAAFVATNTLSQGGQVPVLWPALARLGIKIAFAYTSFKWANLAAYNAGITVIIVGVRRGAVPQPRLFEESPEQTLQRREVSNINGYLAPTADIYISPSQQPLAALPRMSFGNHPYYGNALIMSAGEASALRDQEPSAENFLRPFYGSSEVIYAVPRHCIWVTDDEAVEANRIADFRKRFALVEAARASKRSDATAKALIEKPYRFRDQSTALSHFIAVPQTSSENRDYLPCDLMTARPVVSFKCFAINDAPLWAMALVASRLHWNWIGTVCGRLELRFSYSNTLGWNTFPVPPITEKNKADLTRCAEDILLAREAHFPATIADLYDPAEMPDDLRAAHDRNDETLERIYIGRRFKNDTERLEKLFELYTRMTAEKRSEVRGQARRADVGPLTSDP